MLIGPPIPERQLFQKLILKIQGQGHGWGQSSKSQRESNILSTHIPLVPCQSALPFLRYSIFKIWPWKSKVKVIAQGHKVGITTYRLISLSLHVNRPSRSWDTAISKFDVENSRSRSWMRSKLKVTTWVQHSVDSHPFHSMSIRHPIPELQLFQNLTLKIKGQGHGSKSGPCAAWFDKFLANGQAHMGQMGKWPWQCTTTGLDNSTELSSTEGRGVKMVWIKKIHVLTITKWCRNWWRGFPL